MKKSSTYRIAAAVLVSVFCVFNIGLPIVIYACPMMNQAPYTSACCDNTSNRQGVQLQVSMNRSCCKTIFAAERNRTEFVHTKDLSTVFHYGVIPLLHNETVLTPSVLITSLKLYSASPPLFTDDIPIVTSSLLI